MTAMPLLTLTELESVAPAFRGKAGNALARFLMKKLAVGQVTNMYTIVEKMTGADLIVKP